MPTSLTQGQDEPQKHHVDVCSCFTLHIIPGSIFTQCTHCEFHIYILLMVLTPQHVIACKHVIAEVSLRIFFHFSCILGFGSAQRRDVGTVGLLVVASITVRTRRYPTKRFHGGKENHTVASSERVSVSALAQEIIPIRVSADSAQNKNTQLK